MSWILSGREVWKDSDCRTVGRILSRVINVVLSSSGTMYKLRLANY
jgi:hypothetical protein